MNEILREKTNLSLLEFGQHGKILGRRQAPDMAPPTCPLLAASTRHPWVLRGRCSWGCRGVRGVGEAMQVGLCGWAGCSLPLLDIPVASQSLNSEISLPGFLTAAVPPGFVGGLGHP